MKNNLEPRLLRKMSNKKNLILTLNLKNSKMQNKKWLKNGRMQNSKPN